MAWVIKSNPHDRVVAYPLGDSGIRIRKMKLDQEEKHSHFPIEHDLFRPLTGLSGGLRHSQVTRPFQVEVRTYAKPLLGLFDTGLGQVVSDTARQVFEEIEPGVHQFFPLELKLKDGSPLNEPFFLLNVCNRKDTIAIDDCVDVAVRWPDKEACAERYFYGCHPRKLAGIAVKKSEINGLSMWFDWRIRMLMASDHLIDRLLEKEVIRMEEKEPYFLHRIREV